MPFIIAQSGRLRLENTCTPHEPFSVFVDNRERRYGTYKSAERMYRKLSELQDQISRDTKKTDR